MSAEPFSLGTRVLGAGSALLVLFLIVGFALPGTWSAERSALIRAGPDAVYPLVDAPSSWSRWTSWPDSGVVREGPRRGVGARLRWDDPELGDGTFEIVEAVSPTRVRYRVEIEGGRMRTEGVFSLTVETGGTRVTWKEEGDFGWNPLMGYWARFMERAQGREMEKALNRLGVLAVEGAESRSGITPPAASPR